MRIQELFQKLRGHQEAKVIERAQALAIESPGERAISEGDLEGLKADNLAAEAMYEVGLGEVRRMADQ